METLLNTEVLHWGIPDNIKLPWNKYQWKALDIKSMQQWTRGGKSVFTVTEVLHVPTDQLLGCYLLWDTNVLQGVNINFSPSYPS